MLCVSEEMFALFSVRVLRNALFFVDKYCRHITILYIYEDNVNNDEQNKELYLIFQKVILIK